jgi:hypothetical protein
MGDDRDYCRNAADGRSAAGICNARGDNAGLSAVWMVNIVVANLEAAILRCQARGGKLPAGAIAALYQ